MKKCLKIRFNKQEAVLCDGKITTSFLPHPITVDEEFEDGSYLCHYINNEKVYLKKTDKGDYYTNLFGKVIDPYCFVSDTLDAVFCLVSRNANTSLVLSGLLCEGFNVEDYPNSKFFWHDSELMKICRSKGYVKKLSEICHRNFKHHYLVIDEPYKRYIRALNRIFIDESLLKVDEEWKQKGKEKEFIDEMLYFSDLIENDEHFIWERHLGLQSTYYEKCLEFYPKWEFVKLSELPQWWEKSFKSKWLKNNVSSPSQRKFTISDFNKDQKEKLDKYLEKDVELWNKNS